MVDLSKHLARAKQAIERRAYDLAIEITTECQEGDPANLENYRLLIDAAKRRAKEGGKKAFGLGLGGMSKDPHKAMSAAAKKVAKSPDLKSFAAAGQAAEKVLESGVKSMIDVGILFYEEARGTGLFNEEVLWSLGNLYHQRSVAKDSREDLDIAIQLLGELLRGNRTHGEAGRAIKNWEAEKSIRGRGQAGKANDYASQLASDDGARRNEVMNKMIRTVDDARDVLRYVDGDLEQKPEDKALWLKKGDVHRRIKEFDQAAAAYSKAKALDAHDFVVDMKLSDCEIEKRKQAALDAKQAGQDITPLLQEILQLEIAAYRERSERQPTEMSHRFELATRLFKVGDVDGAAAEFQRSVKDPKYRRKSHDYLGRCFSKKGLLDLAKKQFTECLALIEDNLSEDYKETIYNRARVSEALQDTDGAVEDFTKVVEIDLGYKDAADRLAKLRG